MKLVDVHCHLDHELFDNRLDEVINNAKKAGVKTIITAGTNPEANRKAIELAEKYDIVEAALGAYPLDLLENNFLDVELKFIQKNKEKIIAVSEVGMDFKFVKDKNNEQIENFQKIIDFSKKIKKPMVIHSRSAEKEVIDMLESAGVKKAVLHSFGGRKSLVKKSADLGFCFSIPPVITRLRHFEMIVENVNVNQLLTETDSPWLGPMHGEYNEPANVFHSINRIAEIKKLDPEEAANNVFMNFQRVFR